MKIIARQLERSKNSSAIPKLQQELAETKKQLNSILNKWKFGDTPIRTSQEFLNNFEPWINTQLENSKKHQEQLRKINILFDEDAKDYETIEFNGLYSLLQQIAERERERERESKIKEPKKDDEEIKPIHSRYRKKEK